MCLEASSPLPLAICYSNVGSLKFIKCLCELLISSQLKHCGWKRRLKGRE